MASAKKTGLKKPHKEEEYRKCNLCDKAYMVMLRISLKTNGYMYLCRECHAELAERIGGWRSE